MESNVTNCDIYKGGVIMKERIKKFENADEELIRMWNKREEEELKEIGEIINKIDNEIFKEGE